MVASAASGPLNLAVFVPWSSTLSKNSQTLTGPKPKEILVETFGIDYLIRTPKVEKLSLQPIRTPLNPS